MSYEGYIQVICKAGHRGGDIDCSHSLNSWKCHHLVKNVECGAEVGETNDCDDTNCDSYGFREVVIVTPEVIEVCNLGHKHVTTAETVRFSKEEYYYDQVEGKFVEIRGQSSILSQE